MPHITKPQQCFVLSVAFLTLCSVTSNAASPSKISSSKDDGYRGIWFRLGQLNGPYGDKYSGGLGTYTAKHVPLAIYSKEANKTFFVYGGSLPDQRHLLIMASYYDHATGTVPKPTIVHDKQGVTDPHDNASICLDDDGYVWVFVSGRGRGRPGFKYRSTQPYSTDSFERITEEEMTYPQPWFIPGRGFVHMFTKYTKGRELYWETSPDGRTWSADHKLVGFGGHYQSTQRRGNLIASAFNYHPGTVDKRTNLYYVQTTDLGQTWTTVDGQVLTTPLDSVKNPALVRDYESEGLLVYMKDVNFDAVGRPVILYITSHHHAPGPKGDPRTWTIAHWQGDQWAFRDVALTDHNYDMGSLYIEDDGTWRIVAPTAPGPQPYGTGGEMVAWISHDEGKTWEEAAQLTSGSAYNQSYARRPVNANPDFYSFWADGDAFAESPSHLYFANQAGDQVRVLPAAMTSATAKPEPVKKTKLRRVPVAKGWAKNSINATIFRRESLTTFGDTQYIAFYDNDSNMVLAKRRLGSTDWEIKTTRFKGNTRDAHNGISIAVDGKGVLHAAWDHHNNKLHYARATEPGSLVLGDMLPMTSQHEDSVSYPEFYNMPDGGLVFMYRAGGSGRGNTMINRYDVQTEAWTPIQHPIIDGQGQRNAYTSQIAVDQQGVWHLFWNWRESGDVASNHDLCYARSADKGETWTQSDGTPYTLPITADNAEVAWPVPQKHELINQCSSAVDALGRPMMATYWRPPGTKIPQYQVVWYDGAKWQASQVTQRKTPFSLSGGGTKRIPISRPKLAVDKDGAVYMIFRDAERGSRVSVAVSKDKDHQQWDIHDLTEESVDMWEPAFDSQLWNRTGVLHIFVQRVGQGDAETLEAVEPQMVSVLEWYP